MKTAIELANGKPSSIDDDLYAWAIEAAAMLRQQAEQIEKLGDDLLAQSLAYSNEIKSLKADAARLDLLEAGLVEPQTASTKPVVSQKTAETVDKDCDTCNNRQRRMHQEPCFSCHGYTNWEPKP